MFDRFIRLARARKALREQRLHEALQLAADPLIAGDRRAEQIRTVATTRLLERARARLAAGEVGIAEFELKRLQQLAPGDEVEALRAEAAACVVAHASEAATAQRRALELRRLLEVGDLRRAEELLQLGDAPDGGELRQRIAARREQCATQLDAASSAAADGDLRLAVAAVQQALAADRDPPLPRRVLAFRAVAREAARQLGREVDGDQLESALRTFSMTSSALPELLEEPALARECERLVSLVATVLDRAASIGDAIEVAQRARAANLPDEGRAEPVVAALLALGQEEEHGRARVAALGTVEAHARAAGLDLLAAKASAAHRATASAEERLVAARQHLTDGRLEAARALLVAFLADDPLHEGARRDLELVDEGLADLDRRLADARLLLRGGELRAACTAAMALIGSARIAGEAQEILAEARGRMALIDKGLDEVRVALHGRAAATPEGVRHCLRRLEELAKVQVDHPDLGAVTASVAVELETLHRLDAANAALAGGRLTEVAGAVLELVAARRRLLAVERIDARLCRLGDEVAQRGDRALRDGRHRDITILADALETLQPVRADFVMRAAEWRAAVVGLEQRADDLVKQARARLAERDLAEAEKLLELAQEACAEAPAVQALSVQLGRVRRHAATLDQVASLAREKDFLGAHQKLQGMGEVPALLRTRIYDMKQDLARAQGLEGAFLLRVDEGGEHLVLRGETICVGNVRQGRADLPVLANLAGRHASIRRSMSFHGGMQDKIAADDGELRVGGVTRREHLLCAGDKVSLGPAFGFQYLRPTSRSLSSSLQLGSGFQVAGTDRVILMKDRGRDGRILIGPGGDVHVRVPRATGEVEVFATPTGQVRVASSQGGTIDGVPFKGEHPVAAGQVVEAVGITFLMLPWQPGV
ncbi:MAG: hypothetical protein H6835_05775 [Planctomycetes bacterium]|nr:hypothetical protein [Planctomycetota bacterium]